MDQNRQSLDQQLLLLFGFLAQEHFERIAHACLVRQGLLPPLSPDGAQTGGQPGDKAEGNPAAGNSAAAPNPFPLVYAGELSGQP